MNFKEIAQRNYEAFKKGDGAAIVSNAAPNVEWSHESGVPNDLPWLGKFHGPQGVGEYLTHLTREIEFHTFETPLMVAEGNHVITLVRYDATVRRNGVRATAEAIHVGTYNEQGQLVRFQVFSDTAGMMALYTAAAVKA